MVAPGLLQQGQDELATIFCRLRRKKMVSKPCLKKSFWGCVGQHNFNTYIMSHSVFYLVVSGSRHFSNSPLLASHLSAALRKQPGLVLVCGSGKGCDTLVRQWAASHKVPLLVAPAHWSSLGKAAGPIRNQFMLSMAQGVLAFPLAGSKGTAHVIRSAKQLGLPLRVVAA